MEEEINNYSNSRDDNYEKRLNELSFNIDKLNFELKKN